MPTRTTVTAADLANWASRREAQELFPVLLRKLILATGVGLEKVGIPAYEGIQIGGWDGIVEASAIGDVHVPSGSSAWEFGVTKDVATKAKNDFEKRTKNPLGVVCATSTFVYATPQRWSKKRQWAQEAQAATNWKDVRLYDADDIELWLERAPAVLAWFGELIGLRPDDAWELGSYWRDWAASTQPALTPDIVLAGRDDTVAALAAWWESGAQSATVAASSREEAIAVIGAFAEQLPPDARDRIHSSTLIVASDAAWQRLSRFDRSLVLLPRAEGLEIGAALRHGHRVLIPAELATIRDSPGVIRVGRLSRRGVAAGLVGQGIPEPRADELAGLGSKSLLALRRELSAVKGSLRPMWSYDGELVKLLPLLFLGRWNQDHEGDRAAVAVLAGTSYEQVEVALLRLEAAGDPPARRIGATWRAVSLSELWASLAPLIRADLLRQYLDLAIAILTQIDAQRSLEAKIQSGFSSTLQPYSDILRHGVAESLLFLSVHGEGMPASAQESVSEAARRAVRQAMEKAVADPSVAVSLAPLLPDLIEAAPDEVLRALDADLRSDKPTLASLFQENDADFFASAPHTGLLWALERLAWSPVFLTAAVQQLSRLARLDPGGKLANRPLASLIDIFRAWQPATSASIDQRLEALDIVRRDEPEVAWQVMTSLLPTGHDSAMVKPPPRWRDWAGEGRRQVSMDEYAAALTSLISRILEDVGPIGPRWHSLVDALGHLPANLLQLILARLEGQPVDTVPDGDREAVRARLRSLATRHRSVSDPHHRLPDHILARLDHAIARLQPTSLPHRYCWLYSWWPAVDRAPGEPLEMRQAAIGQAQEEAARDLCDSGGLHALMECARLAEEPHILGECTGRQRLLDEDVAWLPGAIADQTPSSRRFALGYIRGHFASDGWEWVKGLIARAKNSWSSDPVADILVVLPYGSVAWDLADALGADVAQRYWARIGHLALDDPNDCERATARLLDAKRPLTAVSLLGLYADRASKPLDPECVATALSAAMHYDGEDRPAIATFDYAVGKLLDLLTESNAIDEERLAALEWAWLPLFKFGRRMPTALHRKLEREPAFFVDLIKALYRGEGEASRESTAQEKHYASVAHDLLQNWHSPPGLQRPGETSERELSEWVDAARGLLRACNRSAVGDLSLGRLLSGAPHGGDGVWPHESVRNLIERLGSDDLEQGIAIGVYNARGVVTKDPREGGVGERALADMYEGYATQVAQRWPRTSALLRSMASMYRRDAKREDLDADAFDDL